MVGHASGSDEHEDKQSRRCRAPVISFAAALRGRESPHNGLELAKMTLGMFFPRVVAQVGEGSGGNEHRIKTVSVFLCTLQLTALLSKGFRHLLHCPYAPCIRASPS